MPELPEVENVKQSLLRMGFVGQEFSKTEFLRAGLRVPFPLGMARRLRGQKILAVHRRAKFLLFETEKFYVLNHLGMTGSWRSLTREPLKKHDHMVIHFLSGLKLAFNDPRRFGLVDLIVKSDLLKSRWLRHLGVEPLTEEFNLNYLFSLTRKVKAPLKGFIMDQKRVVGVGNIYASEALFAAGVRPTRQASRLTRAEADRLVAAIKRILQAAIDAGGSTIRDYRNSEGMDGTFQTRFLVYDKAGEPCSRCGTAIRAKAIAGRNTFWCPRCQR